MRPIDSRVIAVLLGACLLTAVEATAQGVGARSHSSGFLLGGYVAGSALSSTDQNNESGGGGGVRLGWGFTPRWMVYTGLDASKIQINDPDPDYDGKYWLVHFDVGSRFHFASSARAWVPYLNVAFTGRAVGTGLADNSGQAHEVGFSGSSFTFGGGTQFHFNPALAMDLGLNWTRGKFTDVQIDNVKVALDPDDVDESTSTRFTVGLSWYPGGRSR